MAANVESMAYDKRETPWHGLGTPMEAGCSREQFQTAAKLNWDTELEAVFLADNTQIPDFLAHIRTYDRQFLGIVPATYETCTNNQLFTMVDSLVVAGKATYDTAGSLDNGRKIFIVIKLPNIYEVCKGDTILPYITAMTSHDTTYATRAYSTGTRTVCSNTFRASLSDRFAQERKEASGKTPVRGVRIKHTRNSAQRLDEGQAILHGIVADYDQYVAHARLLVDRKLDQKALQSYFDSVFMPPSDIVSGPTKAELLQTAREMILRGDKNAAKAEALFLQIANYEEISDVKTRHHKERNDTLLNLYSRPHCNVGDGSGSLWSAYNAITEYVDHYSATRQTIDGNQSEMRFNALLFGPKAMIKQTAWESALTLAT